MFCGGAENVECPSTQKSKQCLIVSVKVFKKSFFMCIMKLKYYQMKDGSRPMKKVRKRRECSCSGSHQAKGSNRENLIENNKKQGLSCVREKDQMS